MCRLQQGASSTKIVVGIATYGRTWKLDSDSEISGVPPLHTDGPGEAGKLFIVYYISKLKVVSNTIVVDYNWCHVLNLMCLRQRKKNL